ncbi:toprim domain-containing protein [Chitinimonas sp.]|uniref:DUF7146 domain-containing protein n=1 Tax=Chitinimonas sp. TaxID=1934313 RepID=UPI0035B03A47
MARIDLLQLKEAARNRWPAILQAAGIEPRFLARRHGPCPVCGGKDRFRFNDRDGRGTFICNQHAPEGGDGFTLLAAWLNRSFIESARWVSDYLGGAAVAASTAPRPDPAKVAAEAAAREAKRRQAQERNLARWRAARPVTADSPVATYLQRRGIALSAFPAALRCHASVDYWQHSDNGKPVKLGSFPAMLAVVQGPVGELVGLHQTFLTPDGHKAAVPAAKKWTATSGEARGAAVRLFPVGPVLAVAEGIETALAVRVANGLPVWAGLSAFGVAHMALPEVVGEVFIFADHDANGTGQQAAETLAARCLAEGRTVRVLLPTTAGCDWLDVLTDAKREAV